MNLTDEPQAQGEVRDPAKPEVHRPHIVDNLLDVEETLGFACAAGLEMEDVCQRRLHALDLGTQDGLAPDIHRYEEVCVREPHGRAIKAPQS